MWDFTEITINDRELFERHLNLHNPQVSELTFTNLFMWRNCYKFRYAVIGKLLCIISVSDKINPFAFIPLGKIKNEDFIRTVECLREYFHMKGWKLEFKRVTEDELAYFKGLANLDTDVIFDRNNSDYIYLTRDLVSLAGKRFDWKRNHIGRFKREYDFEYVPLDEELVDDCHRIMEDWCEERNCKDHNELFCEKLANSEMLNNYGRLGCKGALIRVDGRFEAFTAGEELNGDTAVIHAEKANSKIKGLYAFINQQFCEKEWKGFIYLNREQDLGIEGLRKAKLSYNPVKMIRKYSVYIA